MNRSILVSLLAIGAFLTATQAARTADAEGITAHKIFKEKAAAGSTGPPGARKGLAVPSVPVPGAPGVTPGAFKNVDGLESKMDVVELPGGKDATTRKRPGRTKYGDVTLKKGYVEYTEGKGPDGLSQKVAPGTAQPSRPVLKQGAGKLQAK